MLKLFKKLPFAWRSSLIFTGLTLIELFFFLAFVDYNQEILLILFLIEKVFLFFPLLINFIYNLRILEKSGEALAGGDLNYQTDVSKLFPLLRKHAKNLNAASYGLEKAMDERMKSERTKTELITNVSHDIKTPLTSIINYADLIQKEETENEKIHEYAEVVGRQSNRLKRLLDDLIEISKANNGTMEVDLQCCDAALFLTQILAEYEDKLAAASLQPILTIPDEVIQISADGRRMFRIFDNLLNNICKYALPNTRVYFSLEKIDDYAVFLFRNISSDALNISPEELTDRFVRGDKARHTEGNGLGLAIAKSLAELQSGTMQVIIDGDLFKTILSFPVSQKP